MELFSITWNRKSRAKAKENVTLEKFERSMEGIYAMRINKLLSNYGICSRKDTRRLIEDKRIIVNGKICTQGQWVEESDDILLDNKKIKPKRKIYIAFNKPVGVTCTAAKDVKNNIIDYIDYPDYIFPIGRLDKDSQGLIILTNDGELSNSILNSENMHEKEYVVKVDKEYNDEFIENMKKPVDIVSGITRPCKVERIDKITFKIILTQGLNRQIRRMCKKFGYNVEYLQRIRILNVNLGSLGLGEYRYITDDEINEMKNIVNNM